MSKLFLSATLALILGAPIQGTNEDGKDPAARAAEILGLRVTDIDGRIHRLGMHEGTGATVLVFIDTTCPISNRYAPRMSELAREAEKADIGFFGVLSDPTLSTAEAREHRNEFTLSFPVLLDASGDIAARLRPTHVPEAFVVNDIDHVVYRGRIDDRFQAVGKLRARIGSHDLLEAMQGVTDGLEIATSRTDPVGCVFEAWASSSDEVDVTYHRDVAPILNANCVECHRDGDVGPFALDTYEDARRRARMIAQVTGTGTMPPWFASPDWGHFRDERALSRRQVRVLEAWAKADAPMGDPSDAIPAPEFPTKRWRLGEPDLVVEMPAAFEIPASGEDIYRWFVIPNDLKEDRAITAIDFRPGDPSVVHHCIVYSDFDGTAREADESTPLPGFSVRGEYADAPDARFQASGNDTTNQIAGWAPGTQPYVLPSGTAQRLKAGGDFVLEIHYHLSGKATSDQSALALYFADGPVESYTQGLVIGTQNINIQPGDPEYLRHVWMDVPEDMAIIDISPHMHNLGRSVEVSATLPNGTEEPLIKIDSWDFRWQGAYFYRQPVHLQKGSRIDAYFSFDNSADNPFNPSDPPIRVREGWRTFDEMCMLFLTVVPDDPGSRDEIYSETVASFRRSGAPD